MSSFTDSIVIAGAGIGGLTLAIALQRRGIPVRVLERTRTLSPVGAGLTLQPNAMAVLQALGLTDAVIAAGQRVGRAAMLDASGRLLGREGVVDQGFGESGSGRQAQQAGDAFPAFQGRQQHQGDTPRQPAGIGKIHCRDPVQPSRPGGRIGSTV